MLGNFQNMVLNVQKKGESFIKIDFNVLNIV
jgi:hypothetical protein